MRKIVTILATVLLLGVPGTLRAQYYSINIDL